MKKKALSECSLEELQQQRKDLKSAMASLRNGWIVVLLIMAFVLKNLLPTFIPLAIATLIPTYASMNKIDIEIKKREEIKP